ncbi:MAG: excinuclease ABC subunit C [Candidatus Magasanikbacteria bacterium CG10_big_fil_rev_8_21_14_0_10_47_10]|uniref:Excinuclease ABC subunit C n=1 Tax=Candidatus Magasanikbacteria bacterium CG10_big_fil_rev_8_21_14_0_10_47_10 TaxID=1974652 RepID=A0A2H0TR36_9BACT|nr:MAG: excinuclease ABC subunit C [Candidatus Magasanikbacteria bacterium CG10_big_fil_rev_8_21_14_0_10_47_10]
MYYIVYVLQSKKYPHRKYIGYTANLQKRVKIHNSGMVHSTKKWKPWIPIYAEMYLEKLDALGRERFLKSGSGWKYIKKQLRHYLKHHENLTKEATKKTIDPTLRDQ